MDAFGYLSSQMLVHILLMNAVAPLIAFGFTVNQPRFGPGIRRSAQGYMFSAMIAQLLLLWLWHAPPVLDAVIRSSRLHLIMQVSLLIAATAFWSAVLLAREFYRWRAVLALFVTGKLFCLLGVLLVFAPRVLYTVVATEHGHPAHATIALADQQLAGMLMLIACPAAYVITGLVIAARWLSRSEENGAAIARPYLRKELS